MTEGTEHGLEIVFGGLLFLMGLTLLFQLYGALLWRL